MMPVSAEDSVANIVLPLGPERVASGDSLSPGTDTSALMGKAAKRAPRKIKQDGMSQWAPLAGEMGVGSTGDMQCANTRTTRRESQGLADTPPRRACNGSPIRPRSVLIT